MYLVNRHPRSMKNKTFSITGAGGFPIDCDLTINETCETSEMVIFIHGFKGFKDWGTHRLVAAFFAKHNIAFLKFNFSHNGIKDPSSDVFDDLDAFAQNTFNKELFDLHKVITHVQSGIHFKAPEKIYLIGHSLGGGIAILQTNLDARVNKLITWASVDNFRKLWSPEAEQIWKEKGVLYFPNSRTNQQMPIYRTLLDELEQDAHQLDIKSAASNIKKPWLIIHGDQDTTVDYSHAQHLHSLNPQSHLFTIKNGDHVFNGKHPWEEQELPAELHLACKHTLDFIHN